MVAVAVGAPPPAEHGKMATYLKRTSKLFDLTLTRPSADVSLRELMCPVCRGILIEPVTLPCTHNLCLRCLRGTFEHNSLSCPLCRVRVGSWLRTATKSESLVNNGLWELIRAKFPKEIEDKHNGDERDIELDAGFSTTNKILSAAGEIRTEYEAQLQMAEEEMRRQREAEQIASEALIRKIQAEEQQQQLAQLAQDQLFAKTLAKKQAAQKQKEASKCYAEYPSVSAPNCSFDMSKFNVAALTDVSSSKIESQGLEGGKMNFLEMRDGSELRRSNIALISKIRAERYASSMKANASNVYKDASVKFCCQKPMPVYNAITRTLKHQAVTTVTQPCTSSYAAEPGSSTSKIYGMQSKEELHVPNDVVNSKKKSLGVEVCMTLAEDDERIGSAESAGSHDSINQEIHHFKPIRAMPRTPLKISTDGRQIDPKLIRVVPTLKRISNAVPKPPSQSHLKRIIGCSWSAFKGKTRQGSREKEVLCKEESAVEPEERPSTSYHQPQLTAKLAKAQTHDTIRRLDFVPEVCVDSNKNCTKSVNRFLNGTKVSKKLSLDEHADVGKVQKSWKTHVRNGMVAKCKRRRNVWSVRKDGRSTTEEKDLEENDAKTTASSSASLKPSSPCDEPRESLEDDAAVENIAERIKRRKVVNVDKKLAQSASSSELEFGSLLGSKRTTRKRYCGNDDQDEASADEDSTVEKKSRTRPTRSTFPRTKRQKARGSTQSNLGSSEKSESLRANGKTSGLRKSARNTKNSNGSSSNEQQEVASEKSTSNGIRYGYNDSEPRVECGPNANNVPSIGERQNLSDDDVIKEQERMERLVIQEKEDFELARRLQAKFDEMGRIAGRTRRSRRAIESESIEVDLYKIEIGRTVGRSANAKRETVGVSVSVNSEAKKRGRPPKRVK